MSHKAHKCLLPRVKFGAVTRQSSPHPFQPRPSNSMSPTYSEYWRRRHQRENTTSDVSTSMHRPVWEVLRRDLKSCTDLHGSKDYFHIKRSIQNVTPMYSTEYTLAMLIHTPVLNILPFFSFYLRFLSHNPMQSANILPRPFRTYILSVLFGRFQYNLWMCAGRKVCRSVGC